MSSRPHHVRHVRHLSPGLRMALLPAVLLGIALPVDWLRRRRAPAHALSLE